MFRALRLQCHGVTARDDRGEEEQRETAEDCGLPADEHQQLAAELRTLGVPVDEIIPSIRSVEQIE